MTAVSKITAHTTAEPTTDHRVTTCLGPLFVREVGTGQHTVVLWPSIFTDHRIYDGILARLAGQMRFVLIDGPGHGQSDGPTTPFTMADCAKAMAAVLDHMGLQLAIVGGTSWGGMVGAELALTQPERVQSVVLMNTPMTIGAQAPSLSSRMIAFGALWMCRQSAFRNGVAKSFFSDGALEEVPAYAAAFHDMLTHAQPRKLAAAVRSVLLRGLPLCSRIGDITQPVLVIAGKQDAMYPIGIQAKAALLAPRGHFEALEGKHISVVEQPQAVADALAAFVHGEGRQ